MYKHTSPMEKDIAHKWFQMTKLSHSRHSAMPIIGRYRTFISEAIITMYWWICTSWSWGKFLSPCMLCYTQNGEPTIHRHAHPVLSLTFHGCCRLKAILQHQTHVWALNRLTVIEAWCVVHIAAQRSLTNVLWSGMDIDSIRMVQREAKGGIWHPYL